MVAREAITHPTSTSSLLAANHVSDLPRYERPQEIALARDPAAPCECVPFEAVQALIAGSTLSTGTRALLVGLLRTGATRVFPGGGVGIEYGSLLKTAVRPEYVREHLREVAEHLADQNVDLLLIPGMSGYPIGSAYAIASGLPAVLLKKQRARQDEDDSYPPGSFVIPSYTGDGDVIISADLDAVRDIVESLVGPQLVAQRAAPKVLLTIRAAGADDIIDKATMAQAITERAPLFCQAALDDVISEHRRRTRDRRPIETRVQVVAWVTPLIKAYNAPHEHLMKWFGITPFAGVTVTSVHLDPNAIGVAGVGVLGFATSR